MTILDKEEKNERLKRKKKKKKQNIFLYKLLSFILIIISMVTLGTVIFNELLPISYLIPIIIVLMVVIYAITFILNKNKLKAWIKNLFSILAVLLIILEVCILFFGTKTLKFLSNLADTGYRVESFGVYVLDSSEVKKLKDLHDKKITYLTTSDEENVNEVLDKIKKDINITVDHKDMLGDLLESLKEGSTDAILLEESYEAIIKDEFEEYANKLRLIKSYETVDIVDVKKSEKDITKDAFLVYISGIDTSGNVASKARSDVNILMAINPKTHQILMINTPRDYYVTLPSKGNKDKLTHAGIYGIEESVKTLNNLYGKEIDYYARINFTSFVKIINALGGIKVDVPMSFCEQDSKRSFKQGDLICLSPGLQQLNGEQALALSRHRKTIGDRARGKNQMLVLEATINKAISPKIITKYNSILNSLEGRVVTNMTTNEMVSFIKQQMQDNTSWNFNTISANGVNASLPCHALGNLKASVIEPYEDTIKAVKLALDNLYNGETDVLKGTKELTTSKTTTN